MAKNSEKFEVRLDADISVMRQRLAEADREIVKYSGSATTNLKKIETTVQSLGRVFSTLGIGAIAGAAFNKVVTGAQDAIHQMAELNDQAERLGISAENIQKLGVIALQNGSSFEQMTESLDQFTRRLGDAKTGQGELADVLEQYAVAVTDASGQSRTSIEVLYELADVLASVTDKNEQARIATAAFGKSGAELVTFLGQGSGAIKALGAEAQATGIILDDALIAKAAEFDDAWKIATYSASSYFKSFVVDASSQLESLAQIGFKIGEQSANNWKTILGAGSSGEGFSKIDLSGVKSQMSDLEAITSGGSVGGGIDTFGATLERRMANLGQLKNPFADYNKKVEESAKKAADAQQKKYKDVLTNLGFETDQLSRSNVEQEIYNNLKVAGVDISSREGQMIATATTRYREMADQLKATQSAGESMAKGITDGLNSAILGADSFGSALSGILNNLASQVLTKYATGPLGDFIGGALASAFQFEDGGIMTARGPVPLRAYAAGGVASSPQLALYGEGSRPEAYVPLPDGRTIPVTLQGGSGAGSSVQVNQNINVTTGVEQTVRAEIMRFMPQFEQLAVSAVTTARARGASV